MHIGYLRHMQNTEELARVLGEALLIYEVDRAYGVQIPPPMVMCANLHVLRSSYAWEPERFRWDRVSEARPPTDPSGSGDPIGGPVGAS